MPAPAGLRLSPEKTAVVHIDEGFDFLGFTIRRMRKRGTDKHYVYTTPSRKAVQAIKDKVSAKTYRSTRHQDLDQVILGLAGLARCRVVVDRSRHRERKTKARLGFPHAGPRLANRTSPAQISVCGPLPA